MISFNKTSDYVCTHSKLSKVDNKVFVTLLNKELGKMTSPAKVHQTLTDFSFFIGREESDLERIEMVEEYIKAKLDQHAALTDLLSDYLVYLDAIADLIREYND